MKQYITARQLYVACQDRWLRENRPVYYDPQTMAYRVADAVNHGLNELHNALSRSGYLDLAPQLMTRYYYQELASYDLQDVPEFNVTELLPNS